MPGREIPLVNEEIYHVINRAVNSQRVFSCNSDYHQFLNRLKYYQNNNLSLRYSHLDDLPFVVRDDLLNNIGYSQIFATKFNKYLTCSLTFNLR